MRDIMNEGEGPSSWFSFRTSAQNQTLGASTSIEGRRLFTRGNQGYCSHSSTRTRSLALQFVWESCPIFLDQVLGPPQVAQGS